MAKLSKKDREQLEADLATLKRAVSQCEREIAADDAADKAAEAESQAAAVKAIADGGSGDKREQTRRGILAIREAGGTRISDVVYRDRK